MRRIGIVGLVSLVVGFAPPAAADQWLLGSPLEFSASTERDFGGAVSFTPRLPSVFDLDEARVSITYAPLAASSDVFGASERDGGFAVGGALAVEDVVIRGELVQTGSGVDQRDTVAASVAVGDVTTHLSYGDRNETGELRFTLGADLDTAPGMSVGAGVALGETNDPERGDGTAGIVRFRLSF